MMPTQKEPLLPAVFRVDQNLLRELGVISENLHRDYFPDSLGSDTLEPDALLLGRLVTGLTPEDWTEINRAYDLHAWTLIPLQPQAARAVQTLTKTLDQLIFQRDHDPLTGLANRRYFKTQLELELERAARTATPLCLIMLDLDYFKQINDTYGHLCGDRVLQELGAFLQRSCRPYDLAARYGGEEFCLILPGILPWKGKLTAGRILQEFSSITFQEGSLAPFQVTFSSGVAGVSLKSGYAVSPEQLIKKADEALYTAKRQGRNRVLLMEDDALMNNSALVLPAEKLLLFRNNFGKH